MYTNVALAVHKVALAMYTNVSLRVHLHNRTNLLDTSNLFQVNTEELSTVMLNPRQIMIQKTILLS